MTIDDAIAELRVQHDALLSDIEAARRRVGVLEQKLVPIEAEMRGLERAREIVGAAATPATAAPPVRHPVQSTVTGYLDNVGAASEAKIIEDTGLPPDSVRQFLGRAVRQGKLRVDENERYSLPTSPEAQEEVVVTAPPVQAYPGIAVYTPEANAPSVHD